MSMSDMFDRYTHRRIKNTPEVVVDICAGDHSIAKYYLRKYPSCQVLSYDIIEEEQALRTVPAHLRHRITYIQMNMTHLTELDIARHIRTA